MTTFSSNTITIVNQMKVAELSQKLKNRDFASELANICFNGITKVETVEDFRQYTTEDNYDHCFQFLDITCADGIVRVGIYPDGTLLNFEVRSNENLNHKVSENKTSISITWHIEDVQDIAREKFNTTLCDQDAFQVLEFVKHHHDPCIGINQDVICCAVEVLQQSNELP
jgi:hypothetical protein